MPTGFPQRPPMPPPGPIPNGKGPDRPHAWGRPVRVTAGIAVAVTSGLLFFVLIHGLLRPLAANALAVAPSGRIANTLQWLLDVADKPGVVLQLAVVLGLYSGLAGFAILTERGRGGRRQPIVTIYALLSIPVLLLAVFLYIPATSALYHAFTRWEIGGESHWVGLEHFIRLLSDEVFLKSAANLAKLGTFMLVTQLTMPLVVAEMIFHLRHERWRYICRVLVVLPMIVPGVVIFMVWRYIYSDAGLLTETLYLLNLHEWVRGWLSDPDTALWAIAMVGFPFALGFHVLIYYAGLNNIPASVLEAAHVDGLSAMGSIFRIHIPLILEQFKLLLIFTMIIVVNGFEMVMILTDDGGPGYETLVPGLYMYQNGFTYQQMGYACAIGLVMLIFLLVFTVVMNRLFSRTGGNDR